MKDEALKLALEALEKSVATCFDWYSHGQVMNRPEHFINQAITAIKQALAAQPAPVQSCYCPNCEAMGKELAALKAQPAPVQDSTCNETLRAQDKAYPRTCKKCGKGPCIGAPKQPPAQPAPVQEPVAQSLIKALTHAVEIAEAKRFGTWDDLLQYRVLLNTPPAAQRQWVGLTDEEILKLAYPIRWQEVDDFEADKAVNFAQAIEAKLKENNND
jgi:hypothetical protein